MKNKKMIGSNMNAQSGKKRGRAFWGYLEGIVSVIINTVLFVMKYGVGVATHSIAIIADAWHTLSDSLTSLVVIIGFKISAVKPDKQHPFGHGRAELVSAVIIATLLGVVGFGFLRESVNRFIRHETAVYSLAAFIIFIFSAGIKEWLARFSIALGRKINSQSLRADGWHHRSDAVASGLILLGMFANRYIWWVDSVMGIMVSLLIFYAAYDILRASVSTLMGEVPDEEFIALLKQAVGHNGISMGKIHHLHLHRYGEHVELTFHLKLPPEMPLLEAHSVADKLEKTIKKELNIEATIHIEPLSLI
ncbi:MAG: cation diffusion facilitator family transporter [Candidatus Omnitrophota bacterium]